MVGHGVAGYAIYCVACPAMLDLCTIQSQKVNALIISRVIGYSSKNVQNKWLNKYDFLEIVRELLNKNG